MKEFEQLFLQKVRESGKKGHRHNLADDLDYQYTLNLFGGETFLQKDFPEVYKILCATKAHHEKVQEKGYDKLVDTAGDGYEDSAKIRYVNLDPATDFSTASSIHRTVENPQLMILCQVRDETNNKAMDGFAIEETFTTFLEGSVKQPYVKLIQSKDREFEVNGTFVWVKGYDGSGNPILDMLTADVKDVKIIGYASIVESITIKNPHSVKTGGVKTVIIYDRKPQVNDKYDYFYNLSLQGNNVEVKIPFEGSVKFNPSYKPTGVRMDTFRLQLEHKDFGIINFNKNAAWNQIQWTMNENVLSWKFPEDWQTKINKKTFVKGIGFEVYCEMEVNVNLGNTPFPVPINIVISSEDLAHGDPSYKKINPIDIYWGCVGKDTQVRMADHRLKIISEIQVGEQILDVTGKGVKVEDILTGDEKEMIFVESQSGDTILLTDEHPILTQRGMVMAKNLNAADVLIMENGGKSEVRYVYKKEYNDKVYSLALENQASFIGNSFIIGDFQSQQKAMEQEAVINSAKKPLLEYQKELKELIKIIDANLKQPK